jgi:UDP-GlcNAc:undecaprenyl-phosphate/decaprenyl-phosphate GlcNAc-1-phosphate transferase
VIAIAAFVAGAVASWLLWVGMRRQWTESEVLRRSNYRGHQLPIASGVMVVLAVLAVSGCYFCWTRWGGVSPGEAGRGATLLAGGTLGFGFIGLLDDLVGVTSTKGFAGHLGALRHGRITTGTVKLLGGGVLAVVTAPLTDSTGDLVRGALLIALTANLANLFDRAPGRAIKLSLIGGVVVVVAGAPGWWLTGPLLVVGAGAGLLVADLREHCMLGDTGSNVLGAAVGFGLAISLGPVGQWIAVAVVLALNVASEFLSFSRVIDRVGPLRWFDRLGTLPERKAA